MVQLAALIASQGISEFRVMAGAALTVGVTPVELKEIVYQAVPYVDMAKVFDFLHTTNDVLTEHGIDLPLPGQSTTTQTRLGGAGPDRRQRPGRRHVRNRAGRHPARPALPVSQLLRRPPHPHRHRAARTRAAHLRHACRPGWLRPPGQGSRRPNLNVGNDRARLLSVLTVLIPFIGYPRTLNALAALDEITLVRKD
jgi:4-carboxymuconolactone decarboxylase